MKIFLPIFLLLVTVCTFAQDYADYAKVHSAKIQEVVDYNKSGISFEALKDTGVKIICPEVKQYTCYTDIGTVESGTSQFLLKAGDIISIKYSFDKGVSSVLGCGVYGGNGLGIDSQKVVGDDNYVNFIVDPANADKALTALYLTINNTEKKNATFTLKSAIVYRKLTNNRLDADKILKENPPVNNTIVKDINGAMGITINGQPVSPMGWSAIVPHNQGEDYIKDMVKNTNFKIARCIVPIGDTYLEYYGAGTYQSKNDFNYNYTDRELDRILAANPDTKIILQVVLDSVKWWLAENPDAKGDDAAGFWPDLLNEKWQNVAKDMTRQFIAHIQSNPKYNNAVIGYQLMNGTTLDCSFEVSIKSAGAVKRFREMLKEEYKTDKALQTAWKDTGVTLDTAMPYDLSTPKLSSNFLILAPANDKRYFDTLTYKNRAYTQIISNFCMWVKEATQNRCIVGARAGNFYVGSWVKPYMLDSTDFDGFMKSPYIDYLENWEPYPGRFTGYNGTGDSANPVYAMYLNKKMHMLQDDVRTHTGPERGYGATANEDESVVKQKRVFVHSLISGQQEYLWQMGYYFNSPKLMELWKETEEIYQKSFKKSRKSPAELAIVLDKNYASYIGIDNEFSEPTRGFALVDYPRFLWGRGGVPYETIFIDQLPKYGDKYKVFAFFITPKFGKNELNIIKSVIKSGKTLIFFWADGIVDENNNYNLTALKELTGMNIVASKTPKTWSFLPTKEFAKERNIDANYEMGTIRYPEPALPDPNTYTWQPSFTIDDKDAKIIATYKEDGKPAIAYKKQGKANIIYCASVYMAPELTRYAMNLAKGHVYTDTEDSVYINDTFIGFHTTQFTDKIKLNLKERTPLYDVFNKKEYAANTKFTLTVNPKDTYLLFKGTKKEWEKL